MPTLIWDDIGEKFFETGVRKPVLYLQEKGVYSKGVAWNGVTAINESPSGAEPTALYANDSKYGEITSNEEFGCSIEAYTYPDEFAACDGSASLAEGVYVGQQARKKFGLCYRTSIGNDEDGIEHGYKLHLVYGCLAAPSEKAYATINDSPEAQTFSWDVTTTPVEVPGLKPTSIITVDSRKATPEKMAALEAILYGSDGAEAAEARLPLPAEIAELFKEGI